MNVTRSCVVAATTVVLGATARGGDVGRPPDECMGRPSFPHATWICGDGDWSNAICWSPAVVPDGITAIFDGGPFFIDPGSTNPLTPDAIFVRGGETTIVGASIVLSGNPFWFPSGAALRIGGCGGPAALYLIGGSCFMPTSVEVGTPQPIVICCGGGDDALDTVLDLLGIVQATVTGPGSALVSVNHALLLLDDGIIDFDAAGLLRVSVGSLVEGNGILNCAVVNGGTFAPGDVVPRGVGQIAIGADFVNQATFPFGTGLGGTVAVDLAGPTPVAQHDRLEIDGAALLAGTLAVNLADDRAGEFDPPLGSTFRVVESGSSDPLDSTFAVAVAPSIPGKSLGISFTDLGPGAAIDVIVDASAGNIPLDDGLAKALEEGKPIAAKLAQLDADRRPDLVLLLSRVDADGELLIVANIQTMNGPAGVSIVSDPAVGYPVGPQPSALAVGDLDGDGDIDVVVGNVPPLFGDPRLAFLLPFFNDGTGVLVAAPPIPTAPDTPDALAIAPPGSYGAPIAGAGPLVVGSASTSLVTFWTITLSGASIFSAIQTGAPPATVDPVDVDYNPITDALGSQVDLVVGIADPGLLQVYLADSSGTLGRAPSQVLQMPAGITTLIDGDIDGDGRVDLVASSAATQTVAVVRNGGGLLLPAAPIAMDQAPVSIALSNPDQDGDLDLVVVVAPVDGFGFPNSVVTLRNDGVQSGTLVFAREAALVPNGSDSAELVVPDAGAGDVLLVSVPGATPRADARAGRGDTTLRPLTMPFGDLNRDGAVDGGDLGLLLARWGSRGRMIPGDLNGDGVVDGADLGLLLGAWSG
ncbi:MAG: hypothetical protein U0575_06815 [Phycisphaerales bacterium]